MWSIEFVWRVALHGGAQVLRPPCSKRQTRPHRGWGGGGVISNVISNDTGELHSIYRLAVGSTQICTL